MISGPFFYWLTWDVGYLDEIVAYRSFLELDRERGEFRTVGWSFTPEAFPLPVRRRRRRSKEAVQTVRSLSHTAGSGGERHVAIALRRLPEQPRARTIVDPAGPSEAWVEAVSYPEPQPSRTTTRLETGRRYGPASTTIE